MAEDWHGPARQAVSSLGQSAGRGGAAVGDDAGDWRVTVASSRMQTTPSSTLSASRIPGSAPCRTAACAQASVDRPDDRHNRGPGCRRRQGTALARPKT
jgi:hypothetical protein